jgi:hypothetical protein
VNLNDPTGNVSFSVFYSVCYDGSGGKLFSGTSDGKAKSDELLQYVNDNCQFSNSATVYMNVEYCGVYAYQENKSGDIVSLAIGAGTLAISFFPGVAAIKAVDVGCKIIGGMDILCGAAGLISEPNLAEKDYHMYKVTVNWCEVANVAGFPNVHTCTDYYVEMYFIWNDTRYNNQHWYLFSSNGSESRTVFYT